MAETEVEAKKEIYHIVYLQLGLIVGLAFVLFLFQGIKGGLSSAMGGLAYWLPTMFFVRRVFARNKMQFAKQFVMAFFAGEAVKLLLSAGLFVLIVKYLPVKLLSVVIGYVGAIVAFWIAAIVYLSRQEGASQ